MMARWQLRSISIARPSKRYILIRGNRAWDMDALFVKTFLFYPLLDPTVLRSWCEVHVEVR